jgi:hypothetical protein
METLLSIASIGAMIWFWLDSARAREIATAICAAGCRQRNVQFLDQTVGLQRLGLRWTPSGVRIRRIFRFDYSEEGFGRRRGHIVMVGTNMEEFTLGLVSID